MSNVDDNANKSSEPTPRLPTGSKLDRDVVQPGSTADPSREAEWGEHVKEYFNQDVTPGEALPKATDEAQE
jgi:hypothetical protein